MKPTLSMLLLVLLGIGFLPTASDAQDQPTHAPQNERLFINLTSDQTDRAAMAIMLAQRVLDTRGAHVTIFLNVEGARLADTSIPQSAHVSGATPQDMLTAFMEAGGTVIVCPGCYRNVAGGKADDMLAGVVQGSPDVTFSALFEEGTRVLSY